jgi:hypothetical protein
MDTKLEETINILGKAGFYSEILIPPDQEHFGNWMLLARHHPVAVRVTNDRGVILLDVTDLDTFNRSDSELDWYNWDVVARAIGIEKIGDQLSSFLSNSEAGEKAFSGPNLKSTRDLLHKIELDKRRRFMEGRRIPVRA